MTAQDLTSFLMTSKHLSLHVGVSEKYLFHRVKAEHKEKASVFYGSMEEIKKALMDNITEYDIDVIDSFIKEWKNNREEGILEWDIECSSPIGYSINSSGKRIECKYIRVVIAGNKLGYCVVKTMYPAD